MLAHAWYNLPQRLADIGYTITEWRRCLSFHGLETEDKKRGREEDDLEEIAPKKKKGRTTEPELNPVEKRAWAVGAALGKLALANHPAVADFIRGDEMTLDVEIVASDYEIDVVELGMIRVYDFFLRLTHDHRQLFKRALATSIHDKAEATYADRVTRPAEFLIPTYYWPGAVMPLGDESTVKSVVFTITYAPSNATKRKGR